MITKTNDGCRRINGALSTLITRALRILHSLFLLHSLFYP
jgi:hypothetical protein